MLKKLLFKCSCRPEDAVIKIEGARLFTECRQCLKQSPGIEVSGHRYNPSYYRDEFTWVKPKDTREMEVCHV